MRGKQAGAGHGFGPVGGWISRVMAPRSGQEVI